MSMTDRTLPWMASILLVGSLLVLPASSQELDDRLVAMAGSRAEIDAIEAIEAEESPVNRLTMTDAFLTEYPESELTAEVLRNRMVTYIDLNNDEATLATGEAYIAAESAFFDAKVAEIDDPSDVTGFTQFEMDHFQRLTFAYQSMMLANRDLNRVDEAADYGELALESVEEGWSRQSQVLESGSPEFQEAEQRNTQVRLFLLQTVMTAFQTANNAERTIEYAERALQLDPQNLVTLLTISSVMAERPPANEAERESHFESAREYAEQALDALENFLEAAGAQISAEQRANLLSGAHFTLGTVYLNQEEWGDAQDSFEEALESIPTDANAYLRLGMAYARDEQAEEAMEALARSVSLNGPDQARTLLEQVYEARNEDLTGLDAFIQSQAEEIGQ